jgi:hypothetical protein
LWREALSSYSPGGLPAAEDLLGNWLERSRADLKTLEAWFEEEERKWALNHKEYTSCRTPDQVAAPGEYAAAERDAVFLLSAFISLGEARRTLAWTACCHPRRATRRLAAILPQITGFLLSSLPGKNL